MLPFKVYALCFIIGFAFGVGISGILVRKEEYTKSVTVVIESLPSNLM